MKEINIYNFDDNVKVYYSNKKVELPKDYIDNINRHWEGLINQGKNFFNGDVFTITNISFINNNLEIHVDLTNYAHFLYTMHKGNFAGYDCTVIYSSVFIETSDKKFVIGVMGRDTLAPEKLQFIGGGIDKEDLKGNLLDLKHNIEKEIFEEIGIDISDNSIVKSLKPYILKDGGKSNFLSAIFKLDLHLTAKELMDRFKSFSDMNISKGITPELSSLFMIDANVAAVESFIKVNQRHKDENLIPTLKVATGLISIGELSEIISLKSLLC